MHLTAEHIELVRQGNPVHADDTEVGVPCVVILADQFWRFVEMTDEPLSQDEVGVLVKQAMREYDAADPTLDLYQIVRSQMNSVRHAVRHC